MMMEKTCRHLLGTIFSSTCLVAQASAEQACERYLAAGRYLAYVDCTGDGNDLFSIHDRSVGLSFMDADDRAEALFEQTDLAEAVDQKKARPVAPALKGFVRHDALPVLEKLASSRQIVMLNEAHHVSRHRVFALQVARMLRKLGFGYIAVEALSDPGMVQKLGYVSLDDDGAGYYTVDPEFAYFLLEAVALGFTLVSYEAFDADTVAQREQGQASNLVALLRRDPAAKIFVYAGYGHIRKNRSAEGLDFMARRLAEESGIVPLSIDQDGGTPRYFSALHDPVWVAANKPALRRASVFVKGRELLVSAVYKGGVDVTVFHPAGRLIDTRPDWLYPGRHRHHVTAAAIGEHRPALVHAVRLGDRNGVPIDQVAVTDRGGAVLLLPPGTYLIGVETLAAGNKRLYQVTIR